MKIKTIFGYIIGMILGILCLSNLYDGWDVSNWYELLIAYLVVMLPFALGLLFLSYYASKNISSWQKKIAVTGILISVISLVLPLIQIIYVVLVYY